MCENLGYNAVKRAGNFFHSRSKNEEGVFFHGLVQIKESQSTSEVLLMAGKNEFCCIPSFLFYCYATCNCFKRVCFTPVLQRVQAPGKLMDLLKVKYHLFLLYVLAVGTQAGSRHMYTYERSSTEFLLWMKWRTIQDVHHA